MLVYNHMNNENFLLENTLLNDNTSVQLVDNHVSWSEEVEEILERVRINCVNLSECHRKRYYHFKGYGKYFRVPLIILASINSTASVGLQPLMEQQIISGITCLIGMVMGILGAMELYLGIQSSMDLELKQSKEFYTLAVDIYKTLSLRRENRGEDGKDYLNHKYGIYVKLCEASNLLRKPLGTDLLVSIPVDDINSTTKKSEGNFEIYKPRPLEHESYRRSSIKPIRDVIATSELDLVQPKELQETQEKEDDFDDKINEKV